jgi:hypothetical protein
MTFCICSTCHAAFSRPCLSPNSVLCFSFDDSEQIGEWYIIIVRFRRVARPTGFYLPGRGFELFRDGGVGGHDAPRYGISKKEDCRASPGVSSYREL